MANEFDEGLSLGTPPSAEPNEFDEGLSLGTPPSKTSILGTLATHAATEAPSMFGGMAGAGAGAELGGAVGAFGGPFAPVTVPVGALLGGIGGFMLGAHYTHKAQDYALSQVAPKWKDALEETERTQEKEHPYASFIGGLIPYTLTLSPFGAARKLLKPNATSFERMMADPRAARVFGAGIMGGLEAGNEYLSEDGISWPKVAIATGFGLVFNKPYGWGEKISGFGERVARPIAAPIEQAAVRRYPTLIDAWNMKQAGPGATEETASGTAKMNLEAEAAANAAKQAELAVFEPPANPHLRRTVETMYPDMMATWNSLHAIEAELLHGKEEGWRSPDLDAITARIHELSPEVQQAFQRAEQTAPHAAASARRGATLLPTEETPPTAPGIPQPEPVQNVSRETLPGAEIPPGAESPYATTAMKAAIAADIEREMLAAGRPPQEAKDAAAFRTARLAALATAFRGKIGTAEDLYRQWASIIGGARRARRAVPPAEGTPLAPAAPSAPVPARAAPNVKGALSAVTRPNSPTLGGGTVADPISLHLLKTRPGTLEKVEDFLAKNGIGPLRPLEGGYGVSSVVLDAGDRVVRLGFGDLGKVPTVPEYVTPIASGQFGIARVEILPKVDTTGITPADVAEMQSHLAARGLHWSDAAADNLGRDSEGNLRIIDGRIGPQPATPAPARGEPEHIVGAAVIGKDGRVFAGDVHSGASAQAADFYGVFDPYEKGLLNEASLDGFLTSHGRVVGREEALAIAERAQQEGDYERAKQTGLRGEQLYNLRGDDLKQALDLANAGRASPRNARIAHSVAAQTGNPAVDAVINDPVVKARIDNPTIENSSEVPYGAGASAKPDDPTTHLDKSIPRQATISGVTFDTGIPANIHEQVEKAVMEREIAKFRAEHGREPNKTEMNAIWHYAHHDFAEPAENAWVRAQGIDVHEYNIQWIKWLRKTSTEDTADVPADLYRKPYNATVEGRLHGDKDIAALSDEEAARKLFAERPPGGEGAAAPEATAAAESLPPPIEVKPKSGPRGAAPAMAQDAPPGAERMPNGAYKLPIQDKEGKEIGYFEFHVTDQAVQSHFPFIESEFQGAGEGVKAYERLIDWALSTGREFWSDTSVSPSATRIYEALERRGYTVVRKEPEAIGQPRFKITAVPPPIEIKPKSGPRGAAAKPEETWSLLQFLAAKGGIRNDEKLISDLRSTFGGGNRNYFVPSFGTLIRPPKQISEAARRGGRFAPKTLDAAREAAAEAGYLRMDSTPADLLELIDREVRGNRVYREGYLPPERQMDPVERELHEHRFIESLQDKVKANGGELSETESVRAREIWLHEGVSDPDEIIERIFLESKDDADRAGTYEPIYVPGWDDAAHAAGTPRPGDVLREPSGGEGTAGEPVGPPGSEDAGADIEFFQRQRRRGPRDLIAEREAEGQLPLPGTERIGQGELAQRKAEEPLKPTVEQKPMDIGLFGDEAKQRELFQREQYNLHFVHPDDLVFREHEQNRLEQVRGLYPEAIDDPIVTIRDDASEEILDGHNRATVAKERGQSVPAVSLSRYEYETLKAAHFDDMEIAYATLSDAEQHEAASAINRQFPGAKVAERGVKAEEQLRDLREQMFGDQAKQWEFFQGETEKPPTLGSMFRSAGAKRGQEKPKFEPFKERLAQTPEEIASEKALYEKILEESRKRSSAALPMEQSSERLDYRSAGATPAMTHTAGEVPDEYLKMLKEGKITEPNFIARMVSLGWDGERIKAAIASVKAREPLPEFKPFKPKIGQDAYDEGYAHAQRGIGRRQGVYDQKNYDLGYFAGREGRPRELPQGPQGSILGIAPFVEGARPSIWLSPKANASTIIHESGHEYAEQMFHYAQHPDAPEWMVKDTETLAKHAGAKVGEPIPTRAHEKIAKWLEQYFREGTAPTPELAGVFQRFKQWLRTIYQTLKGLGSPLNDDVRKVFDRWFTDEPGRIPTAPPRPEPWTEANTWEERAGATDPEEMHGKTDQTLAEIGKVANSIPGVMRNELNAKHAALAAEDAARTQPAGEAGLHPEPGADLPKAHEPAGPLPPSIVAGEEALPGIPRSGEVGAGGAGLREPGERPAGVGEQPGGAGDQPLAPTGSNSLDTPESLNVGKNFNVRVENITSQEQLMRALDESAERIAVEDGVTGQVVSMGEMLDLAEDFAVDAKTVTQQELINRFGVKNLAAKIVALRRAVRDAAQLFHDATVRARDSSNPADIVAAVSALQRVDMIHSVLSSVTSEMGRGLGMGFRPLEGVEGVKDVNALNQLLKDQTGRTLFQWGNFTRLASELDGVKNVSQFVRDQKKHSFGKMILEYWINGLISGPTTHITYMIGNALLALQKAGPETAAAALIGAVRRGMGREGDTVRLGEIGAQFKAGGRAITPALKAAVDALRTGLTTALPGETEASLLPLQIGGQPIAPPILDEAARLQDVMGSVFGLMRGIKESFLATGALPETAPMVAARYSNLGAVPDIEFRLGGGGFAIPLGGIVRAPGRGVAGIHSFYRSLVYSMQKAAGAYRSAANAVDTHGNPLTGEAFDRHVANKLTNPSEREMQEYATAATETALMGKGGPLANAVANLTNVTVNLPLLGDTQILKFIDPFVKISGNILKQTIVERTPAGILSSEIRADLSGARGTVVQDTAMARMLMGTSYALLIGGLAAEGYVTGSGPTDPKDAAAWRELGGNQPHSVRIGDMWYDIHRLGPLGMLMGIAADMYEVAHAANEGEFLEAGMHLQHAITQNILDESFMRGPSDLIKAVDDPGRYGEQYIRSTLSSFIPYSVGMAQVARAADPYTRQARTVMDEIKRKIPGLSQELYPRRDIWGEPAVRTALWGTAIYQTHINTDPVSQAMLQLGIWPGHVKRNIRNQPLDDEQYDEFQRIAGRSIKPRLDVIVNSRDFAAWPNHVRRNVIQEVIHKGREAARGLMFMKYPQILRDATQARMDQMMED